jgi:hypothetical protein
MLDEYNSWTHLMWVDNCNERDDWGMQRLSKEEYIQKNKDFLDKTHSLENPYFFVCILLSRDVAYPSHLSHFSCQPT